MNVRIPLLYAVPVAVLLVGGCHRGSTDAFTRSGGVEAQVILDAPHGTMIPEAIRKEFALRVQRSLQAKGWPDASLLMTNSDQFTVRVPLIAGRTAEDATRDIQALQTVPPVQMVALDRVRYRAGAGWCGDAFSPMEYVGRGRFLESGTGDALSDAEVRALVMSNPLMNGMQLTGADILPGTARARSSEPLTVEFRIPEGRTDEWSQAGRWLRGLMVNGHICCVMAPDGTEGMHMPSSPLLGSLRVQPGGDDTSVVSLRMPVRTSLQTARELARRINAGAVPAAPVSVRVVSCATIPPGGFSVSRRWHGPRPGRWVEARYTLAPASGRGRSEASICRATMQALEARARLVSRECHFAATDNRHVVAWIRVRRSFGAPSSAPSDLPLTQDVDLCVLSLRPDQDGGKTWRPQYRGEWVMWRTADGRQQKRGCRVDQLDDTLRRNRSNTLLTAGDIVPGSARVMTVPDEGDGDQRVVLALKPKGAARLQEFEAAHPGVCEGIFVNGRLLGLYTPGRNATRTSRSAIREWWATPLGFGGLELNGESSYEDADRLAKMINLPRLPVSIVASNWRSVNLDPESAPWMRLPAVAGE